MRWTRSLCEMLVRRPQNGHVEGRQLGLRPAAADLIAQLHGNAGRRWLGDLPALVSYAQHRWRLRVGDAYPGCTIAFAAPAWPLDGARDLQVIKAVPSLDEACREAAALEQWNGHLAPRLLEFDRDRGILLLEAIQPGEAAEFRCPRDQWPGGSREESPKASGRTRLRMAVDCKLWAPPFTT